jgi:hypothetical protein
MIDLCAYYTGQSEPTPTLVPSPSWARSDSTKLTPPPPPIYAYAVAIFNLILVGFELGDPELILRGNTHNTSTLKIFWGFYQCWTVLWSFKEPPVSVLQIFHNQRTISSSSLNISESKNHQFRFFRNSLQIQNQRTVDSCHFKNLKELTGFVKELEKKRQFFGWFFDCFENFEIGQVSIYPGF